MVDKVTEEMINDLEIDLDNLGCDYKGALKEIDTLKTRVRELEIWEAGNWNKKPPIINQTVLIEHELGAGRNYDVACYSGKDNRGDDRYMLHDKTEILKSNVIKWRALN